MSVADSDLSILIDIKQQQRQSHPSHEIPPTVKSIKSVQRYAKKPRNKYESNKHLIPLVKPEDNEPEEITVLRQMKLIEGQSKDRLSTYATTIADQRNYVRLDSCRRSNSKSRSKSAKKRPQTSNIYQIRATSDKPTRIMTATIRK